MPDLVALAILILAAYRATRLIVLDDVLGEYPDPQPPEPEVDEVPYGDDTTDLILEPAHPRGTFIRKAIDIALYDEHGADRTAFHGYLARLYTCTFCVGFWVSLLIVCLWLRADPVALGVDGWLLVAAVAGGQGYVSSRHNA